VKTHECCKCKEKVDIEDRSIPAKWFGLFEKWEPVRVICAPCRKKPGNDDWWK